MAMVRSNVGPASSPFPSVRWAVVVALSAALAASGTAVLRRASGRVVGRAPVMWPLLVPASLDEPPRPPCGRPSRSGPGMTLLSLRPECDGYFQRVVAPHLK